VALDPALLEPVVPATAPLPVPAALAVVALLPAGAAPLSVFEATLPPTPIGPS
jgi:hypothetical protein